MDKSDYSGGGTSVVRRPTEIDTTASPDDNDDGTTTQVLADASGFAAPASVTTASSRGADSSTNATDAAREVIEELAAEAERSDEAEARRRSIGTTPGAFHVRPRRPSDITNDDEQEMGDGRSVDTSGAAVLPEQVRGEAAVVDAQVEAVAVQIDEAVATYQAVPVVDALTTSRIDEDGEELSYQLESGQSQSQSASHASAISSLTGARFDSPSADATAPHHRSSQSTLPETSPHIGEKSGEVSIPRRYLKCGLGALLLAAVALGLGLGLARPLTTDGEGELQEDDTTISADNGTGPNNNQDESFTYRLIEVEILPKTPPMESVDSIASSLSLGIFTPTEIPGTMSRSLIVGWDQDDGVVKVYRSKMIKTNDSVSFEPFIESASLYDIGKVNVGEQDGSGQENGGTRESSSIIVDAGVDGESFALSYRNFVRLYTSKNHETQRQWTLGKVGIETDERTPVRAIPVGNETNSDSIQWYQRGRTLVGDDDPAIRGFGSSIGYSFSGPHLFRRLVVGSDSGHVRAYRYRWTNDTVPKWQRLDGGLLDPPTNATGKAVVAMAGSGLRFVVGYPNLGKVSLYTFKDELVIDEDASDSSRIELIDEVYSESGVKGDMFGRSLSVDAFANFIIVGAKGYARAYWLRPSPAGVTGYRLLSAGGAILGDESDGDEFGVAVASGRIPAHNGGCMGCPFILDKQRIAISSPYYADGRGRVVLYQYNEDQEIWETLASPIEGDTVGDEVAQAVRFSPDMGTVAVTSAVGEAEVFRLLPLR